MNLVRNPSHRSIATASIYMASHILRYPKAPEEISQISGISADQIRSIYEQVYPNWMHVIDPRILDEIAGDDVEGMLALLPRPERGTEIIDHGESHAKFDVDIFLLLLIFRTRQREYALLSNWSWVV